MAALVHTHTDDNPDCLACEREAIDAQDDREALIDFLAPDTFKVME